MKKLLLSLCLVIFASAVCFAQNALWAGNAARGNDDIYPASVRSSGKAAGMSLALPEGTLVQVKNQKNGQTVDVTIVAGQGKPGIFLLLNSAASDALDIHSGEVIMVEIREKSSVSNPFLDYSADPDRFKKSLNDEIVSPRQNDPDNTATVDVEGEMNKMGYEETEESTAVEEEESVPVVDSPVLAAAEEPSITEDTAIPEDTTVEAEPAGDTLLLSPDGADEDIDTPDAILEEEEAELVTAVREDDIPEGEIVVPETDGSRDFEDIIIADSEETYDAVLNYGDTKEEKTEEVAVEENPVPEEKVTAVEETSSPAVTEEPAESEPEAEGTPFLAEDLTLTDLNGQEEISEPVESEAVPEERSTPPVDPGRVIYFLTPAELRPPEPVEDEETPLPVWEKDEDSLSLTASTSDSGEGTAALSEADPVAEGDILIADSSENGEGAESPVIEPEIHFEPQYVELDELEKYIRETLEDGSRYVQVASFGRRDYSQIYGNMVNLQKSFPYLPMILLPVEGESTLKLMVGPVSRDEVGILLYAMKANGFADAFLNR